MRLLLAALTVVLGSILLIPLVIEAGWIDPPSVVGMVIFGGSWLLLVIVVYFVFRPKVPTIEQLQNEGLVGSTDFRAVRCFRRQDYNDEGPHYFVELEDGRVLYFVGQYLYDYEPIADEAELNQPRRFPCSEFSLLRHKGDQRILDMECGGIPLEPEINANVKNPLTALRQFFGYIPRDGEFISQFDYATLKANINELSR